MKKMIAIVTKHTDRRLPTNSENGSFQNRPHLIHRMCPNRFQPLYQQVLNLKEQQKTFDAKKIAREILHKKVKVLSPEVRQIRNEMRELLKER